MTGGESREGVTPSRTMRAIIEVEVGIDPAIPDKLAAEYLTGKVKEMCQNANGAHVWIQAGTLTAFTSPGFQNIEYLVDKIRVEQDTITKGFLATAAVDSNPSRVIEAAKTKYLKCEEAIRFLYQLMDGDASEDI